MNISFTAQEVSYVDAMDGEIIQVTFDAEDNCECTEITKPYFMVSVNYEFSEIGPHIEWFDGKDFDAGAQVTKYSLNEQNFHAELDNGMIFNITLNAEKSLINKIDMLFSEIFVV